MSNALTDKQKSLIKLWETQFPKFNDQQVNLFFKLFDLLGFIRDYPLTTTSKRQFVKPSVIFTVFDSVSSDLDYSMNIIEMANIIQTNEFVGLEYAINTLIDNGLVQYSSEQESTVANPGPFYKRVYNTSDISDKLKKLDSEVGYYEAEVINSNSENEVLFEYFKRIKELDNITANIALDEKTIVLDFFTSTLDLPCFWSKDHRRFRQLLTDWYTAQRTMISKAKNLNDIYSLNNSELNELISSFGFPYPHEISTRKKAIFLSNLIQMYKYKGTPRTFVQALEYFDFNDIVLSEWYIDVNENGLDEGFVARSVPVYPRSEKNNELLINTMPYENFIESDSLWYLDNTGIVNSNNVESIYDIYNDSNTKIKLPSLTSIISVTANANIQNIKVDLSILHRKLQESFEYLVSNVMEFVYLDSTNTYIDLYVGNQFDSTSVDYYINGLSYADNTDRVLIYISENYNGNDYSDFKNCLLYKYNINGKTNKNPIKTNDKQRIFSKISPKYVQTFKTHANQVKYHFFTSDFSLIPDDYYPDTYFVYNGEQYIPLIGLFNSSSVENTLKNSFYNSLVLGDDLDTTSERIDLKTSLNKDINLSINYETSFSLLEVYLVIDYLLNIQTIINPDTEEVRYLYNKDVCFSNNSLMDENGDLNESIARIGYNRFFQYSNKKNLPFDINNDDISDNVNTGILNSGSFDKIRKEYDSYIHMGDTRKKKMISAFYDSLNNTYYPLGYYINIPNEYVVDKSVIFNDETRLNLTLAFSDIDEDQFPSYILDTFNDNEFPVNSFITQLTDSGYTVETARFMVLCLLGNLMKYFVFETDEEYFKRNISPYLCEYYSDTTRDEITGLVDNTSSSYYYRVFVRKPEESDLTFGFLSDYEYLDRNYPQLLDDTGIRTYSIEHMTPVYTYVSAKYYQNYKLNKFRDNFTSVYCRNTQELMNAIYDKKYYSPFKSLEDLYTENNQRFYHYKDSFRSMLQTYGPKFFNGNYSGYREDLCYKYITDAYEGFNIHATGSAQLLKALNPDLLYDIERELSMLQVDFDPSESLLKLIENVVNDFEYYCKYYYDLPYLGGISNLMVGVSIYDKIKEVVDFFKPFRARFRNFTVHYNFDNPLEDTGLIDDYIREKKTVDIINGDNADYVTRDIINKNYVPVSERLFIPDNNKLPENWYLNPVESLVNYGNTEVLLGSSYYDLTNGTHADFEIEILNHISGRVNVENSATLDYTFYIYLNGGYDKLVQYNFPDYMGRGKFFIMGMNTVGSNIELTIISQSEYLSISNRDHNMVKLLLPYSYVANYPNVEYEKIFISYGYKRASNNVSMNTGVTYTYENGVIPTNIKERYLLCKSDYIFDIDNFEGDGARSLLYLERPIENLEDVVFNYSVLTDNYYFHTDSTTLHCSGNILTENHIITDTDMSRGYFELEYYPIIPSVGPRNVSCIDVSFDSTSFVQNTDYFLEKDEDKDYPFVGASFLYPDTTSGYFNRIEWNSETMDLEEGDVVTVMYQPNPNRAVMKTGMNLNYINYNDEEENKWINILYEFEFFHDLDNDKISDIYIEYGDDNPNAICFDKNNPVYPNLELSIPINDGLEEITRRDGIKTQTLMGDQSFTYYIEKSYRKLKIRVYGSAACDLGTNNDNKLAVFFMYDKGGSEENIYGYNFKLNTTTRYELLNAYENIYIQENTEILDEFINQRNHHRDGEQTGYLKDGDRWGNLDKEYIDETGDSYTYYNKYTASEISQIKNYNRNYKLIRDNHWQNYQNQNIDQIKLNYLNSVITIDDFNNDRTGSYDLPRGDYIMSYTPVTNPNGTTYYKRSVIGANMALKNEPFYYGTKQNVINLTVEKDSEGNPISIKEHFAYNYPGTTLQYVNEDNDLSVSIDGWVFDSEYYSFIDGTGILCDFAGVGVSEDIVLEYDYDDLYIESSEPIVFQYDIDINPTNLAITEKHICAEIVYLDGTSEKSIFMYISQFYDGNSWSGNDGNVYRVLPSFYNNETNTYYITISKIRIYPVEDITEDNDMPLIPYHVDELGVNSPGFGAYIKNIGFAVEKMVDSQNAQLYLDWFRYPHSVTQHLLDSTGSPIIDYNGNKVPLHMFDRLHTSFLQRFGYQSEGPNLVQPWDINPMNDTRWRSADYRQYEKDIMLFVGKEYKGLTTDYLTFTLKPTYVEADTFKHGMIKYLPYSDTEILNVTQKFDRGITDDQTFTKRVIRFKEFYNNNYTHLYLNGLHPNEDFDLSYFLDNEYSDDVYPGQQGDIPIFDINYMSDPFLSTVSFSIGRQLSKGTQTINMGRLIEKENQTKWPRKEYRQLLNSLGQIYTYNYNSRDPESDFHVNTVNTIFVEAETRRSDLFDCGITYDNGKVIVRPVRALNDSSITVDSTSWYSCTLLNENPYFNNFAANENYLLSTENYIGWDFSEYGQLCVPDIPYNMDGKYAYVYLHYTQNKFNEKKYLYINEGYNNYFSNPPIFNNTRNYVLLGVTGNYYRFKKDKNEYFYTGKDITTTEKNESYTYTDMTRTINLDVDYNIDSEIPIKIEMTSGLSGSTQRITTHNTDFVYSAYVFQTMPLKSIIVDSANEDIYFIGVDDNRYEIDGNEIGTVYPVGGSFGDPIIFPTITRERPDVTIRVNNTSSKTIDISWVENDFSETVVELDSCPITIAAPTAKIELKPEYDIYDYLILACKLSIPESNPINPYISFGLLKDNSNTADDYYIETLNRCYCDEFHQNIKNIQ